MDVTAAASNAPFTFARPNTSVGLRGSPTPQYEYWNGYDWSWGSEAPLDLRELVMRFLVAWDGGATMAEMEAIEDEIATFLGVTKKKGQRYDWIRALDEYLNPPAQEQNFWTRWSGSFSVDGGPVNYGRITATSISVIHSGLKPEEPP